jgi:4-amino-4-deoxy-L-arabinose transferase-like glycosyltransferase
VSGLESIDVALFRFINLKLSNPLFDLVMPQLSANGWFIPVLVLAGAWLLWKGGTRGRLFVLMLALVLGLGDTLVINRVKKWVARPRPYVAVPEAKLLVGRGSSGSLPSSHTSTWTAAAVIAFVYYRRSWRLMLPLAVLMGFSRIYLGVHYPSDVLAGALLGAGYAVAGLWLLDRIWRSIGRHGFPLWWKALPTLLPAEPAQPAPPEARNAGAATAESTRGMARGNETDEAALREKQWLRLGYVVIALLFAARLLYLASGRIELSEDEAYQWLWSKHLALSYYSKPPMIALLQYAGTWLWGDTMFGVRFCPPLLSALLALLLLRFFSREAGARTAFVLVLMANVMPLLAAGSILMTIDPPLVLGWCGAMCAGWRALQPAGRTRDWLAMGCWLGFALLSKYTALFFFASLALFFLLRPEARAWLRRPGPWLALVPVALAALPILIWNSQHDWVTLQHLSENAKLDKPWRPTLRSFIEFTVGEATLLHPIFFVAILVAGWRFWSNARAKPLQLYLFAMGSPVFVGYWLYTLHSRVQLNWIAPAVVPLLGLALLYWEDRRRAGARWVPPVLAVALATGAVVVVVVHDTDLLRRLAKVSLPTRFDPLHRVRAIRDIATVVAEARRELEQKEGTETFIIASHYGLTGQLTFYLPEARAGLPGKPLVYVRTSRVPKNQFFFWPEYRYGETRRGQNAIYVTSTDKPVPPPAELVAQFTTINELGMRSILYGNREFHRIQLYACINCVEP